MVLAEVRRTERRREQFAGQRAADAERVRAIPPGSPGDRSLQCLRVGPYQGRALPLRLTHRSFGRVSVGPPGPVVQTQPGQRCIRRRRCRTSGTDASGDPRRGRTPNWSSSCSHQNRPLPGHLLQDWIAAAGITDGPLLLPVSKGNRPLPRRLSDQSTTLSSRPPPGPSLESNYSAHSLRAGSVTYAPPTRSLRPAERSNSSGWR